MISAASLTKTFNAGSPSEKQAICDLSLSVGDGEFVAIVGGNGAGKSTLLNLLSGALAIDIGRVEIDGKDVTDMREFRRAAFVARVFQDPMIGTAPSLSIAENMILALLRTRRRGLRTAQTSTRTARIRDALRPLNLGLEDRLDLPAGSLSGGQRQAMALAMATLDPPRLLLLDEHTAALDPGTSELVMSSTATLVSRLSLTTLMVTHNMDHALRYASRILMMNAGRIVADLNSAEIANMKVSDLVARFGLKDDRLLLRDAAG